MVVCLNWTISWQERLFPAAATCWKRCIQRVRQITAVQEQSNTKETVNQKAAQLLEARETTVRTNLRRGRLQLKEILEGEYDFAEV